MKDFYDIFYLSGMFNFSGAILQKAILETENHRGHVLDEEVFLRIKDFPSNYFLITQWKAFIPAKEAGLSLDAAINNLQQFLDPIVRSILTGHPFEKQWICIDRIWK